MFSSNLKSTIRYLRFSFCLAMTYTIMFFFIFLSVIGKILTFGWMPALLVVVYKSVKVLMKYSEYKSKSHHAYIDFCD